MTFSDIKNYTFWGARSRVLKWIALNKLQQITYVSPKNNKVRMKEMLKLCNSKIKYPHMREEILKTVLFGSYVIFNGKSEPSWQIDQYLKI